MKVKFESGEEAGLLHNGQMIYSRQVKTGTIDVCKRCLKPSKILIGDKCLYCWRNKK